MKAAVEQEFGSMDIVEAAGPYDATKLNVTDLVRQWDLGPSAGDKFISPLPVSMIRTVDISTIPSGYVHVAQWKPDEWWVFHSDGAAAAATRRFGLYTYNPKTTVSAFVGFITVTFPVATTHTFRGFRCTIDTISTGTVSASGTAVTGSGTGWQTARFAVGSRIGFGSTDPTAITTWYQISAIASDTGITLATSAGTIPASTPFVIEEVRMVVAETNATATNGGLYVVKGLNKDVFTVGGTAIPAATTVDNVRASYWLKSASTETLTTAAGMGISPKASNTLHDIYVLNGQGTAVASIYRFNIRAALTPTAGAQVLTAGADLTVTGTQAVVGNIAAVNNGRLATLNHGPGSGVNCFYFVTATRVYRVPVSSITSGNVSFLADNMVEVPPGGVNSQIATNTLVGLEHAAVYDRLIISTSSGDVAYVTDYRTDGGPFERSLFTSGRQSDTAAADSGTALTPGAHTSATSIWSEAGILFVSRQGVTSALSGIHIFPGGADREYADLTGHRIICPKIVLGATPSKFYRASSWDVGFVGSPLLGRSTEDYTLQFRTGGIDDNSGSWDDVPLDGDMSAFSTSSEIQFSFIFRTLGQICIPARVTSLSFIYETADALPSQYRWNFSDSSAASGTFAWVQAALFGGSPTLHTINIYRADTNALVLTQASSGSANGTFEFWNGSAWAAGLGTDTVGTRRRFVPTASLPASIELYATITVA